MRAYARTYTWHIEQTDQFTNIFTQLCVHLFGAGVVDIIIIIIGVLVKVE